MWRMKRNILSFLVGFFVALLGGLIGLGGAEFRLPFLLSLFHFLPLQAVIINKAISLVVVSSSFFSRLEVIPLQTLLGYWSAVLNLLAGSIIGAWVAADWATKVHSKTLQKTIALLLLFIALVLFVEGYILNNALPKPHGYLLIFLALFAGFFIGVVAALMGVAGGELLIPTFVLLYGFDLKLAGSLSLMVSMPTMISAFARYSRDKSFLVLKENHSFVLFMVLGSMAGSYVGGSLLLGIAPESLLRILLVLILLISAYKVWRH